jgi:DNA polymerase-3 subunit gamma/tau
MAMLLQRMAVMQMVPSMAHDGEDPDTQGLADLAQAMPAEETQLLYSLCLHGRTELGLAPDEYAALTMVLLRLLAFKPPAGTAEKKSPLISPSAQLGASDSPRVVAAPLSAPVSAPLTAPHTAPQTAQLTAQTSAPLTGSTAVPVALDAPPPAAVAPKAESVSPPPAVPPAALASGEPPPWEDWPDTTDYADPDGQAPAHSVAAPSAPALRALPVREAPEPSARLDMPRAAAPAAVQATPEGDVWLDVVQGLLDQEAITALVRELALQSQLLGRDGAHWQLRVERETLNHAASRERLQAALLASGHGDVKLHIEMGPVSDSPARRLAVKAAEKMLAAQELIQNDPLVQAMVRDFGAKIVPGSIQLI